MLRLSFFPRVFGSLALAAGLAMSAPASFAAGGGGGGGGGAGGGGSGTPQGERESGKTDLTTCESGKVWDAKKKKCLTKRSGVLPDFELAEYAYALAKADRFQEALDTLDLMQNPDTPRALNYRGYATRKLGRTEEGIRYYLRSVEMDPSYAQVREYLGEAYVTLGQFDLAKDQLSRIEKICGSRACEEYEELSYALVQTNAQ